MSARRSKPDPTRRRVVLVAFDGVQALDLVGPMDVFDAAGRVASGDPTRQASYAIEIAAPARRAVRAESGLTLVPTLGLETVRGPIDTLIVAGGRGARVLATDPAAGRAIARLAGRARRVASVCTGAYVLAAAGLLDGRRATTHWAFCERFARAFPSVSVDADAIFVRDGRVWSSAGVSAGIDLALAMVEADLGRDVALTVARYLVLFVRRAGGQSQFSAQLASQLAETDAVRAVQTWIHEHVGAPLAVPALARRAHMSPRNFARVFRREVGTTPGVYVERARVEVARRLLETTRASVDEVATRCGFGSAQTLRRAFARQVGVSPLAYRERFAS